MLLYRGVSIELDKSCNGILMPKGDQNLAIPGCGEVGVVCGAGYECGYSEGNGIRAHQVDSGMKKLSFVSTSKSFDVAKNFATKNGTTSGYVYTLDSKLFDELDIIIVQLENPIYPEEQEVSIRAVNNGPIPKDAIINKQLINYT